MADTPHPPATSRKQLCEAVTATGKPCRCWATPDSVTLYGRPLCASHGRQAKLGGPDALGPRGLYGLYFGADELAALNAFLKATENGQSLAPEVETARVVLRRLLAMMAEPGPGSPTTLQLIPLVLESLKTIAKLVRDNQAITPSQGDSILESIGIALDNISEEWGIKL